MLVDRYDAALFDLDGVIYLGPVAVPGVPEDIDRLREHGTRVGFVTNNAARTPAVVAAHLRDLGIVADADDVVNSTQATLAMMSEELPAGAKVLVLGTDALTEQLEAAGFVALHDLAEQPDAVVQGYNPTTTWRLLEDGVSAIQRGASWYATNPDLTRPTDRGLMPGAGTQIAVVQACVTAQPRMAGKPFPPLLEETVRRLGASRPIFVGDRVDTDVMGANAVGMDSLFVFTGAHGKHDLAVAGPPGRPTWIGHDVSALLSEPRTAEVGDGRAECGGQRVAVSDGVAELLTQPHDLGEQLDALWAALQLGWQQGADLDVLLGELDLVH